MISFSGPGGEGVSSLRWMHFSGSQLGEEGGGGRQLSIAGWVADLAKSQRSNRRER